MTTTSSAAPAVAVAAAQPHHTALTPADALQLYRHMQASRRIDELEQELVARGEAFFHVGAAGHEAVVALAPFLTASDYLHAHYRDKALLLARGVPIREFFDSLLCNAASHSAGRQMSAHLSAPALNVLSTVGPVGNSALQAVGIAQQLKDKGSGAIVVCSMGEGGTQQGEVLEAIAEAVRSALPVLFLIQDNRYAISTRTTGQTFYSLPSGEAESFYGLAVNRVDGMHLQPCHAALGKLVSDLRQLGRPALCVVSVERLVSHTNADDEAAYRSATERHHARLRGDPLHNTRRWLLAQGVNEATLDDLDTSVAVQVRAAMDAALETAALTTVSTTVSAVQPLLMPSAERRGSEGEVRLTMAEALCETLRARMAADPRITLYGQDIEDPKGDVFGVTRGLATAFPGRVRNAPLSESTIVGTAIGRALAGGRPVAFLQFADFLPLAFNQIATELATMEWRTQGGWQAPVILMVSCGAYRPGLGPFHAQTFDSTLAHLPGIDVVVPASATDAAGMLNAAFASGRPTVMLYPKAMLHARIGMTSSDVARQFVPIGRARVLRDGCDLTLVGWGNTVSLCLKAADALAATGLAAEVIDLRALAPWDHETIVRSVTRTRRLLVVHEDNRTAGFGAEIVATVIEGVGGDISCRRVARSDAFVPCHFGLQLQALPSYRRTLEAAADMLALELHWERRADERDDRCTVRAIGSSPADQTVEVVELRACMGQAVRVGEILASVEADKAVFDIASPADGVVERILLRVGDRVAVETPLLTLAVARRHPPQPVGEHEDTPRLTPKRNFDRPQRRAPRVAEAVAVQGLGGVRGNKRLDNAELACVLPRLAEADAGADGILQRTGIESRTVAGPGQNAVSMAVEAARLALNEADVGAHELSLVICSTSTPIMISPSTACQVMQRLAPQAEVAAYDVQAACSGYLYALAQAWDFLQSEPQGRVLVLTTETMRRVVDLLDPQTSPIFADAATATVLGGSAAPGRSLAWVERPVLGARSDDAGALQVPLPMPGAHVRMDGKRVFAEAVRSMCESLTRAAAQSGMALEQIDLIVPHQANGRIIEAIRARLKLPKHRVWNEIRRQGNTSSSSIPLALDTVLRGPDAGKRLGLCAFGAGFTYGAALMSRI